MNPQGWGVYAGQSIEIIFPSAARRATIKTTPSWPGVTRLVCSRTTRDGAREMTYHTLIPGNVVFVATTRPRHGPAATWAGQLVVNPDPPRTVWTKRLVARTTREIDLTELPDSPGDHEPFGALVPASDAVAPAAPAAASGKVRFALGNVEGFQYPLRTTDAGRTWRVDGPWFAGPWADGASFAGTMTTFSSNVAAAWGNGQVLYTTVDAGRHWYMLFFPGTVSAITESRRPSSSSAEVEFTLTQTSPYGPGLEPKETYVSRDGGRVWALVAPSR